MADTQAAVFEFLKNPASHGGREVRRLDTHAASVFLAGESALKVKRAVRFPFLDYSTLDKRRKSCLAELEINRRFSPDIYRRVVPITREANGKLAIGGDGEVLEWAVEMRRFDENQTLDRLADQDAITPALIVKLAASVVAMHENAAPIAAEKWIAAIEGYIDNNTKAFGAFPDVIDPVAADALDSQSRNALARLKPLLIDRGRKGLIRRGHGDLHLGNIASIDGEPVVFDAIEFDPIVASGDVLYDFAFLLMDLVDRDNDELANLLFNSYMGAFPAHEFVDGLGALPLFLSLRAAIRAAVTLARIERAKTGIEEIEAAAKSYFDLALRLLRPAKSAVICVGGLSGTGKSVLARRLSPLIPPAPGALLLRSDVMRKQLFGVEETERLPAAAYNKDVTDRIYTALAERAGRAARAGHSVLVDAVFARPEERAAVERAAQGAGAEFLGLFLMTDLNTRLARIAGRGADASDATERVGREQENYDTGKMEWTLIDAAGEPADVERRTRTIIAAHAREMAKP
jgi:aminoglycoside phosphotransferase family enzyme/predicted kinase